MKMELKRLAVYSFMLFFMATNLSGAFKWSHYENIPVKSIKSADGSVIDCMDTSHQPSFQHRSSLGNRDIQMNPSSFPKQAETIKSKVEKSSITQLWPTNEAQCPEGTLAVLRTKGVGASSSSQQSLGMIMSSKLNSQTAPVDADDTNHAGFAQFAFIAEGRGKHHGARAFMNIWEPHVQANDASSSYLYLVAGSEPNLNAIIVGWRVNPEEHGDSRSRFFVSWTRDSFVSTGCINLQCPGFVQTNNNITLGAPFPLLSSLSGSQFEISILIWKTDDAWWIKYNDEVLGHWPLSLFSDLANSASSVGWGGNVFNSRSDGRQSTTTEMGSGHFPEEGLGRASYMRRLQVVDDTLTLRSLSSPRTFAQQPNCYNISFTASNNNLFGDFIFYGGPGRNPKCP